MKTDITMYGEQELSLHILNTEYLYRQFTRCCDESDLQTLVCEFTYTDEQFKELCSDLRDEIEENRETTINCDLCKKECNYAESHAIEKEGSWMIIGDECCWGSEK